MGNLYLASSTTKIDYGSKILKTKQVYNFSNMSDSLFIGVKQKIKQNEHSQEGRIFDREWFLFLQTLANHSLVKIGFT